MSRLRFTGILGLVVAGCLVLAGSSSAGEKTGEKAQEKPGHDHHVTHFDKCAKVCADCMRACESCAHHCAHLVAQGKKEHMRTLGSCMDCSEFCAAAAKIVSHRGVMSNLICESCAKACDVCGASCKKSPDDEHMQQCAKACRDCAQACREMIEHSKHGSPAAAATSGETQQTQQRIERD